MTELTDIYSIGKLAKRANVDTIALTRFFKGETQSPRFTIEQLTRLSEVIDRAHGHYSQMVFDLRKEKGDTSAEIDLSATIKKILLATQADQLVIACKELLSANVSELDIAFNKISAILENIELKQV